MLGIPDPLPLIDGLLAATAKVHGLPIATGKVFDGNCGLQQDFRIPVLLYRRSLLLLQTPQMALAPQYSSLVNV